MRIYIDFDDVLCETARRLSETAWTLFARRVPYETIAVFDLQLAFSLSDAEIAHLMDYAHRTDFLTNLEPTPGGLDAVRALEAAGHDLTIVTGRPASSHAGSMGWLHRFDLAHMKILYVDKYGRAPDVSTPGVPRTLKLDEFDRLPFDVAIDDAPAALNLLAHRADCTTVVYNRPWNQNYPAPSAMRRCDTWADILALVGRLSQPAVQSA